MDDKQLWNEYTALRERTNRHSILLELLESHDYEKTVGVYRLLELALVGIRSEISGQPTIPEAPARRLAQEQTLAAIVADSDKMRDGIRRGVR